MAVTILESTQSTNLDAHDRRYVHGDAIIALEQTAGRGQRGNRWVCRAGENLTFSMVLEPTFLHAAKQFLLSESVALGVADALAGFGIEARIKWPNDIYVGDMKICGILIENDLRGAELSRSIVGVGLNVNQDDFDPSLPNPTSMCLETEQHYDIMAVFGAVYDAVMARYNLLVAGEYSVLSDDYLGLLYGLDELRTFARPDGSRFAGIIRDVRPSGELVIEHDDSHLETFLFKEVQYVL
ncbi:MAG: biotin--[acetyl-CoA-carboxylase] ligase [Tidjanibacter sp.]|nr:biotin--[acetyl-CoA-carboxylase] ligase [Tidjanibacter sp.]